MLHGMWDLPGPGLEPVSPALAGGLLTSATREVHRMIFLHKKNQKNIFLWKEMVHILLFIYLFIYLAVLGLSCSMQDL